MCSIILMTIFTFNFPIVLLGIKFFPLFPWRSVCHSIFPQMAFISVHPLTWNLGMELSGRKLVGTVIPLSRVLLNCFLKSGIQVQCQQQPMLPAGDLWVFMVASFKSTKQHSLFESHCLISFFLGCSWGRTFFQVELQTFNLEEHERTGRDCWLDAKATFSGLVWGSAPQPVCHLRSRLTPWN